MPTPAPAGRPHVIATDLDGTLLRSDGTLSERTRAALRGVEARGIEVVFVTARPPRWLDELADEVGGHGHVICLNGACVYEVATREVSQVHGFENRAVLEMIMRLRDSIPSVALGIERPRSGPAFDDQYAGTHVVPHGTPRGAIEAFLTDGADPVGKLLARLPGLSPDGADDDAFFGMVTSAVGEGAQLAYSGAVGLAELSPPGVTKASALARWCARNDVGPESVWAFGDMPNDLPMLTWAGRGIAVANAHGTVRAATPHFTASNDDDGVAQMLETLQVGS